MRPDYIYYVIPDKAIKFKGELRISGELSKKIGNGVIVVASVTGAKNENRKTSSLKGILKTFDS